MSISDAKYASRDNKALFKFLYGEFSLLIQLIVIACVISISNLYLGVNCQLDSEN